MKPYSQDLRDRVIAALETQPDTQAAVAEQFGIACSTLEKWWARWQATGSSAALPPAHGPTRVLHASGAFLRAAVKQHPDATLAELSEHLQTAKQVTASVSMVCRELQVLQLPRKKKRA
jgi:transposase